MPREPKRPYLTSNCLKCGAHNSRTRYECRKCGLDLRISDGIKQMMAKKMTEKKP